MPCTHTQVYGTLVAYPPPPPISSSIATNKPTYTNSEAAFRLASSAVDGNLNRDPATAPYCYQSSSVASPWWEVDLLAEYTITTITILSPVSAARTNLAYDDVQVRVGPHPVLSGSTDYTITRNPVCATTTQARFSLMPDTITCGTPMRGRFVTIQVPTGTAVTTLTLCEVQVGVM